MRNPSNHNDQFKSRRIRLHEILIALIQQQDDLELMDEQAPTLNTNMITNKDQDPAEWLDRNRRVLKRYQALVRTAITLDALLDAEKDPLE